MLIRLAQAADHAAIWRILEPVIRAGETYALPRDMNEARALAYWTGPDRETFVAEDGGRIVEPTIRAPTVRRRRPRGQLGVARHRLAITMEGVARAVVRALLRGYEERGFRAMQFNLVVSSNVRALRLWESLGFETVGRLPLAFLHRGAAISTLSSCIERCERSGVSSSGAGSTRNPSS